MALTVDRANAIPRENFAPRVLELGLAKTAVRVSGAGAPLRAGP